MSAWSEYFLNSSPSVALLDCLEISHSNFTQTFYVVRNAPAGVTVLHEDSSSHVYEYYPLRLKRMAARTTLEQSLEVEFGDLGSIIPTQIDAVRAGNGFSEYPKVRYRAYRSDDLETVMDGTAILLEIREFDFTRTGAKFTAKAPSLNVAKTGELFKVARFPMLKGLL